MLHDILPTWLFKQQEYLRKINTTMSSLLRLCQHTNCYFGSKFIPSGFILKNSSACVRLRPLTQRLSNITIRNNRHVKPINLYNQQQINSIRSEKNIICRNFHLTRRLGVHPLIWMFVKPITKLSALLFGRYITTCTISLNETRIKLYWILSDI